VHFPTDDHLSELLTSLNRLRYLNLHSCSLLTDAVMTVMAQHLPDLEYLNLTNSARRLTDRGLSQLAHLRKLKTLHLRDDLRQMTPLATDLGFQFLEHLHCLTALSLPQGPKIAGHFLPLLTELPLQYLSICGQRQCLCCDRMVLGCPLKHLVIDVQGHLSLDDLCSSIWQTCLWRKSNLCRLEIRKAGMLYSPEERRQLRSRLAFGDSGVSHLHLRWSCPLRHCHEELIGRSPCTDQCQMDPMWDNEFC
jgi:hypothetical protein